MLWGIVHDISNPVVDPFIAIVVPDETDGAMPFTSGGGCVVSSLHD
jgi:hypothetical protein